MEKNKLGIVINTTKANNRTSGFRAIYRFNDDEWSSVVRDTGAELKKVTNNSASVPIHFIQFESNGCFYCIMQPIAGRNDYQSAWIFIHKDILLPKGELSSIIQKVEEILSFDVEDGIPRFAVVGRPNAGKSSIINAFIGEDRNIVTEIAGTTRDSIYTRFDKFGFDFYLVDTAGIRRKNKVSEDLEFYSVMRSIRAIENSDVCILMIDATRGIEAQDMNIFQLIQRNNKSLVVVVNKWDLVENKDQAVIKTFENAIRQRMAPFVDFPIIFASALTKQRIFKVLETAKQVYLNRKAHVGTSKLNEVMLPLIEAYPPPSTKGKYIKIKYCTQLPNTQIPSFVFYANLPQYIKEPYRRFLENKIRDNWSMHGCPINVFIRQK